MGANYFTGESIAAAGYTFAPATSGVSVGAAVGATYAWGLYGSVPSNAFGDGMEYFVFDMVGNTINLGIETVKEVAEWTQ